MSKISSTKNLVREEFPRESGWEKLIQVLNPFLSQVYFALVRGLTLADNLKSQTTELRLKSGTTTASFAWTLNERPTAVLIGYIVEDNASPGTIPAHSMQWAYQSGQVTVTFSGLASKDYLIRIIGLV